jgi:adenine-specific DNA-methyltransferase
MQLNAEDGGNRNYLIILLLEPTDENSEAYKEGYKTISDIGKERIRRAGVPVEEQATKAYNATDTQQRQQLKKPDKLDIGFKVFESDSTNLIKWNSNRNNLHLQLTMSGVGPRETPDHKGISRFCLLR